jgi:HAMP domain-containing protein
MLSYLQSLAVVLVSVALALGLTLILNRRLEEPLRERSNLVNGSQLMILGTVYAVLLGFMLSDAWITYQRTHDDVRSEAAATLTIYRSSSLLPSSCAVPMKNAAVEYVKTAITVEWPSMEEHQADFQGSATLARMWTIVDHCSEDETWSETARANIIRSLETLQACREARMEDYSGHLPPLLWGVLLFGAIIVVTASCLLGNESKYIHILHVVSLTVLITVSLLAISDLDRPFDGGTRVDATAFRAVEANINQHQGS